MEWNDIESVCTQSTICSVVFFYSEILISLLSISLYQLFGFQFFFLFLHLTSIKAFVINHTTANAKPLCVHLSLCLQPPA